MLPCRNLCMYVEIIEGKGLRENVSKAKRMVLEGGKSVKEVTIRVDPFVCGEKVWYDTI